VTILEPRATLADPPFVTLSRRLNEVVVTSWITAFGKTEVGVHIYQGPTRPSSWNGIEREIIASLRHPARSKAVSRPELPPVGDDFWKACESQRVEEELVIECKLLSLHIVNETGVANAATTDLRKRGIDLLLQRIPNEHRTVSNRHPHALGAPNSNAVAFDVELTENNATVRGRGLVAVVTTAPDAATSLICFDARDAAAKPTCSELLTHVALHGVPSALAK